MNPVIFSIGNFSLRWYSLLILIGVIIAVLLAERESKKFNIDKDFIFNLSFWAIIFGIIGARAYYVLFNFSLYKSDLLSIFKVWEGGLAIHGGIIAGLITVYLYCKRYNVRILRVLDISVVSLIIAQAIGRWGNFFNGEAHGAATNLATLKDVGIIPNFVINGMYIDGIYYQPTFYYESLWCIAGFIILLVLRRFKYLKVGQLTGIYLLWYGIGRFFIEASRTDSLMFGGFKVAQMVSIAMFLTGMFMVLIISRKGKFVDLYNDADVQKIK